MAQINVKPLDVSTIIALLVLAMSSLIFDVSYATASRDGYWWEKANINDKANILTYYMKGYSLGYNTAHSIDTSVDGHHGIFSSKWRFKNDSLYYINELDSFLQTYPLCRHTSIFDLLQLMMLAWDEDSECSYKLIADICSSSK